MAPVDTSSLAFDYSYTLGGVYPPGAQSLRFDVRRPGAPERLGHGEAVVVDLFGPDPYGSLEGLGKRVRRIRDVTMDRHTRELSSAWAAELDIYGDRLVILAGLSLAAGNEVPAHAVVTHLVAQLSNSAVAVVYRPGADDLPHPLQLWREGLYFRPIRDGVHYLDTSQEAIVRRNDHNRRPPGARLRAC